MRRLDPAQAAAGGIAAAAAALVAGGLALSVFGALDTPGWIAVVVAGAIALLVGARDPGRHALPALLATAAFGLAVGAVALSRASAIDHARETKFTQLWLVQRTTAGRAEVGLRNEEQRPATYRLRVVEPESQGAQPLIERTIRLEPSQAWSEELTIPASPRSELVTAELYRPGDGEPYRAVHVWAVPAP